LERIPFKPILRYISFFGQGLAFPTADQSSFLPVGAFSGPFSNRFASIFLAYRPQGSSHE
jgi:hypothetical protein